METVKDVRAGRLAHPVWKTGRKRSLGPGGVVMGDSAAGQTPRTEAAALEPRSRIVTRPAPSPAKHDIDTSKH